MKKFKWTIFYCILSFTSIYGQSPSWNLLPNSPYAGVSGRHDDLYFVNDSSGWLVNGDGEIWHTNNGGNFWRRQYLQTYYFRSVEFINDSVGFAGTLNYAFYQTQDRGNSWNRIDSRFPAAVEGICGMSHYENSIWGVGIWSSPARLIKSINAGQTWLTMDMSPYAGALVDCWFLNKDTGFVSGQSLRNNPLGIILRTTDGGLTWHQQCTTQGAGEYVWKLQFQNDTIGYASVQSLAGLPSRILKTTDGGITWNDVIVTTGTIYMQGAAFLNDTIGWCGGWSKGLYQTFDGGNNWDYQNIGEAFNRFFKVREGLAYACGTRVYKFTTDSNYIPPPPEPVNPRDPPHSLKISPNPVQDVSQIDCVIDKDTYAILYIMDVSGKLIHRYMDDFINKGRYTFTFSKNEGADGNYILVLQTNERYISIPFQVIRH